jgi:hypothetical protein
MNEMTVAELIRLLEDCDPAAEVRLAHQPHWPLQYTLTGLTTSTDLPQPHPDTEADEEPQTRPDDPDEDLVVVWLLPGDHPEGDRPYAPQQLWHLARRH